MSLYLYVFICGVTGVAIISPVPSRILLPLQVPGRYNQKDDQKIRYRGKNGHSPKSAEIQRSELFRNCRIARVLLPERVHLCVPAVYRDAPGKVPGLTSIYRKAGFAARFLLQSDTILILIPVRVIALPSPGIRAHLLDAVLRLPAQFRLSLIRIRNNR